MTSTFSSEGLQGLLDAIGIPSQNLASIASDINTDPLAICFSHLADLLVQLTDCGQQVAYRSIIWAPDMTHLIVVAPRLRLKDVKAQELAADLQHRFPPSELFGHPVNDGINLLFYFKAAVLARMIFPYIIDRGSSYGKHLESDPPQTDHNGADPKKILVEFSSPNLGKAFDGLHLRSTLIGAFVASAYEHMGWEVNRMNFLGDWGKDIGLLTAGWPRFGSEDLLEADPLAHLLEVHTKTRALLKEQQDAATAEQQEKKQEETSTPVATDIGAERDQYCRKLNDGDPDTLNLWKRFRDSSIAKYTKLYARLGIHFDKYSGESQISKDTLEKVENKLKEKDVYHETHEGWFIEFSKPDEKGLGLAKGRSPDGTTTYLLRDIAAVLERNKKFSFDKMIYVVSARQKSHFQQVFRALELMGYQDLTLKLEHFSFGDVHGLSTKEGASGLLSVALDQCRDATKIALDMDQDFSGHFFGHDPTVVADSLGTLNLMVHVLSLKRGGTVDFDPNKMADAGDYTGVSMQKWYTAIRTRLRGFNIDRSELEAADYSLYEEEDNPYADMLRLLLQYPGIVKTWAFEKFDPSHVLTFLFGVIDLMPSIWEDENEAGGSAQNLAKLALYECVRQTLENGMRLLALVPLTAPSCAVSDIPVRATQAKQLGSAPVLACEPCEPLD